MAGRAGRVIFGNYAEIGTAFDGDFEFVALGFSGNQDVTLWCAMGVSPLSKGDEPTAIMCRFKCCAIGGSAAGQFFRRKPPRPESLS